VANDATGLPEIKPPWPFTLSEACYLSDQLDCRHILRFMYLVFGKRSAT